MKIVIIAGSNRRDSTSTMMSRFVAAILQSRGHTARLWDLFTEPLPFYDPDQGDQPKSANQLANLVADADAIVLATPEYHGSVSGVLKNALDYLDSDYFDGKMVLGISSAGGTVGVSSLQHLQVIVRNVHGIYCPEWISVGGDQRLFNETGEPLQTSVRTRVERVLDTFLELSSKLRA